MLLTIQLARNCICICISLRKSFRQSKDSQSTQHRKAFIGIDQVAELNEIPLITKISFYLRFFLPRYNARCSAVVAPFKYFPLYSNSAISGPNLSLLKC